jgi:transcription initiation factor IIE alpha subunit
LDNILLNKIKSIIRNDTGLGEVHISDAEIYDKLTAAGVEVPELAIAEILERLSKDKLIEIERQVSPEDQEKHSTYVITRVSGKL